MAASSSTAAATQQATYTAIAEQIAAGGAVAKVAIPVAVSAFSPVVSPTVSKYTPLKREEKNKTFWDIFDAAVKAYDMIAPYVVMSTEEKPLLVGPHGEYVTTAAYMNDPWKQWVHLHKYKHRHDNYEDNYHRIKALEISRWTLSYDLWSKMVMYHLSDCLLYCEANHIMYVRDVLAILAKVGCVVYFLCIRIPKTEAIYTHIKLVRTVPRNISGDKSIDIHDDVARITRVHKPLNAIEFMKHMKIYLPVLADGTNLTYDLSNNARIIKDSWIKNNYKIIAAEMQA